MFLFLNRCVYGASVCARTASDALVSVNNVLAVALSDAANRASICASAAADALIGNFVCHDRYLHNSFSKSILSTFFKKINRF